MLNATTMAVPPVRGQERLHGCLLQSAKFLLQNCAIRRNATKISLAIVTSDKDAAQYREKLRKSFSLNYESLV